MSPRKDDETIEILAQIQRDIEEMKNIMKLFLLQSGREVGVELNRLLDNPQKKIAYQLTDGYHSAHDIASKVRVSTTSIHRWWREWQRVGIATRVTRRGRSIVQQNFSLEDMGIQVPDILSLQRNEYEVGEIPREEKLKSILGDSSMFKDNLDLKIFAKRVFSRNFLEKDREDLIREIADSFYGSPKRKQMMFMQALKQQAKRKGSHFKDYFESWEKHIKSEI